MTKILELEQIRFVGLEEARAMRTRRMSLFLMGFNVGIVAVAIIAFFARAS